MAGEYRLPGVLSRLPFEIAEMLRGRYRIARTDTPMVGVIERPDLNEAFASAYDQIEWFKFADMLRSGDRMVIQLPEGDPAPAYFGPGELYMTS